MLESTRNTISIHHGTNGTAEKTTVDTNPQKVLEHENLISDSEYITLNHETGENATHIKTAPLKQELQQLHQTKQDTLVAGDGITIEGQTISATGGGGGGETSYIQVFDTVPEFAAMKHIVSSGDKTLITFSFECYPETAECVITGQLKEELKGWVSPNESISNGAISITNDGTNIKLTNSAQSLNVIQYATFTSFSVGGGGSLE